MRKNKQIAILVASAFMLIGCTPASSSADTPSESDEISSVIESSASTSSSAASSAASTSTSIPYSGKSNSLIDGKDYTIFQKAPEIHFSTKDGDLSWATQPNKDTAKPEVTGKLWTDNCGENFYIDHAEATMKVRGNWTTNYQKKPFRIKFTTKNNLFGLNGGAKFKKWVLFADVKDSSLLRNATAFYMGRQILQDNIFVSDFTPIHLYLNDQYWGMYLLGEQKEVGSKRINVKQPASGYKGTDIGYAFELDHYATDPSTTDPIFTVDYKPNEITWHHSGENYEESGRGNVKSYTMLSDITNEATQIPYIKNRVEMAYTILYDAVMNNKLQEIQNEKVVTSSETDMMKCLQKTIDVDSFIDMFILNQITCNPDVGYSSFYLSLDMSSEGNKLLTLNCPWDFDSALGVRQRAVENAQGDYVGVSSNMWMSLISKAPFFKNVMKEKWNALMEKGFVDKTNAFIDDFSSRYVNDYKQNFQKWPQNIGNNPEVNFETRSEVNKFKTEKEAANFMKSWLNTRLTWINNDVNDIREPTTEEFKTGCTKIRLEAEDAVLGNSKGGQVAEVKSVTGENVSGNQYVSGLDGKNGANMTWTFNSSKTSNKVLVTAGLSARENQTNTFSDMFSITLNGANVKDLGQTFSSQGIQGRDYHYWTYVDIGYAQTLVSGQNTLVITCNGSGTNFDYVDLYIPN